MGTLTEIEQIEGFSDEEWDTVDFMIRCRVTRKIALLLNSAAGLSQTRATDRLASARAALSEIQRRRLLHNAREAQKRKILGWQIYTPAMLKRFLDWTGSTCAFPLCDEPIRARYEWHLCSTHKVRFAMAMHHRKTSAGITKEGTTYGTARTAI